MCYEFRPPPRDLITTRDQEVKGQTLSITKKLHILKSPGLPLICATSGLVNDPYLRITLHRTKARTPLVSHQRDNVTRDPNYLMQCVRGWDHMHLVRTGHLRPRPGRLTPTPQSHPPHWAIPHIKQYDKLEGIHQMNPSPGSISRRLDDMLSTPFSSRIINYDIPIGFLVLKFSVYRLAIRLITSCTTGNS